MNNQGLARVLCITSSDANWLWLSDAVGDRMMLVRESGTFAEISKRVGLVSPNAAIVDFSPQVGLDPSLIVKELTDLSPELPVIALGSKAATDALVKALRSGVRDFLDLESSPGEIQKVMGTVLEKAPRPSGERKGYALMVLGARQGVGATTLSVNLAAQLNKSNNDQTLLLDFGLPLGDALVHLPCEEKQGAMDFVECVRSLRRFDATLAKTAFRKHTETGVAILSLPKNLADLREISASDALKFLNLIKSYFENVVIDLCGFSNIDFVASLLRSADQTLLVTPQSVPGVVTAAELMKALADKGVKSATFDLVVTPHLKELALTPESIATKLGIERVHTLPDRRLALCGAVNEGRVLSVLDTRDPYTKAVAKILEDLGKARQKGDEVEGISQKLKNWFSK
ncbi:MAG: hypothetical protein QE278_00265 [Limnobacter sp.]|nr:hypothetical protein [Limnobacter sp.]